MTNTHIRKTIKILGRIILVLAIFAAVIMGVLKLAERSTESLRLGLQDYLTKATGNPAEIFKLEQVQLYPKIKFLAKGILVRDKDNRDKALISADSGYISMSFWKTFFGIRNYDGLEVKNLELATGFVLPKKVKLDFVGISDPMNSTAPPYFMFDGTYNNRPLLVTAQMVRYGSQKNFHYDFDHEFPVTFKLGATEANAMFKRSLTQVEFAQITLVNGKQEALLSAPDMSFDPLHIPFNGKIAGVPVDGELTKTEEIYTLTITPGQADKKSLAQMKIFIDAVCKDFGIDAKTSNLIIDIKPTNAAAEMPSDDKEKKTK